jgi:Uma2 family endonuclease
MAGQSSISDDDYIEGPPEFIAEVAHSSAGSDSDQVLSGCAAYDLHDKKQVYRRSGVQEYLVWQIEEETVDWFVLDDGTYLSLAPDADGPLASRTFPGLVLHMDALQTGDMATVLDTVQQHLDTDPHRAFVEELRAGA